MAGALRLVLFDDGAGVRPGLQRASWIVDLRAVLGDVPHDLELLATDAGWRMKVEAAQDACVVRAHLRRRDEVRIVAERVA